MKKSETKTSTIEELLQDAGFDFEAVDRCPYLECASCTQAELSVAA